MTSLSFVKLVLAQIHMLECNGYVRLCISRLQDKDCVVVVTSLTIFSWARIITLLCLQMEYGGTCHISGRPYTVFRWRPGNDARYKKTIICQEVAKAKNVCQVCLLDLDYNLPVQVRDQALGVQEDLPDSVAGREFALNKMQEDGEFNRAKFGGAAANDILSKLNRAAPYYKRNQAKICSFFVRGECKRGTECPYRHEMPDASNQAFSNQNIQDRYHGTNDPVAKKILEKVVKMNDSVKPPEDRSITTLFVGGVTDSVSESDIKSAMYVYGELKSVKKIPSRKCAFVTFKYRKDAEEAMIKLGSNLNLNGEKMALLWGNPRKKDSKDASVEVKAGSLPKEADEMYPSMDPAQAGAVIKGQERKRQAESNDDQNLTKYPKTDS